MSPTKERDRSAARTWCDFRRGTRCAVALIALVAAACGSSDDSADPVNDTTTTTTTVDATDVVDPDLVDAPDDAVESQASEPGGEEPEFIELPYAETIDGSEISFTFGECTPPETEPKICEYAISDLILIEDDIGEARENRQGTHRYTQEPCTAADGREGTLIEDNAQGTIVAEDGDEFYFELTAGMCALHGGGVAQLPSTWTVAGGTGRFTDASGDMTFTPAPDGSGGSVGTLIVRADLWDTVRPSADGE